MNVEKQLHQHEMAGDLYFEFNITSLDEEGVADLMNKVFRWEGAVKEVVRVQVNKDGIDTFRVTFRPGAYAYLSTTIREIVRKAHDFQCTLVRTG